MLQASLLTIQHFFLLPNHQPLQAYATSASAKAIKVTSTQPTELTIPDQHIHLPIYPSTQIHGEWQVSTQGVSLLNQEINKKTGGYVIFGHDWPVLLGRLRNAKLGQLISLDNQLNQLYTYKIVSIFTVNANQGDILGLAKPNTLLIYTCSGFLDSQRFVVLAQRQH